MSTELGPYIRERREALKLENKAFSLRQVAQRIEVEPSYLSKVERGREVPSESKLRRLADELDLDSDVLLALAGKVSADLLDVIRKRPELFAQVIRDLASLPDNAVMRVAREVRDGGW
jgi:transcriptional regulator with XRE-family HTH domain